MILGKQVLLSRADLEALPHVRVVAAEHSYGPVNFEGVTLTKVLERAGVIFGESMKGKRLTNCLLVGVAYGYRAVIALPELDPCVHRQAGFAGVLSGWETPQRQRGTVPDRDPRREANGAMGQAGDDPEDRGRSIKINLSESSLP
jgi:hypothetical protein